MISSGQSFEYGMQGMMGRRRVDNDGMCIIVHDGSVEEVSLMPQDREITGGERVRYSLFEAYARNRTSVTTWICPCKKSRSTIEVV